MCGVGGIYLPKGLTISGEHEAMLAAMSEAMRLRGPDAQGLRTEGPVGLVHRRLSILDLDERANQPAESEDWLLSYNGEIYNFREIRAELAGRQPFETTCDTEVLLRALQEWGIDGALDRCAGMFAFLAYNKREGVLYAARDRMGIKPLLMSRLPGAGLCFASSVTAIRAAMPDRAWEPFAPALGSFFSLGAPYTRSSVFEGIERIDPAHYIRCTPDGAFTAHRYWEPRYRPGFTTEELVSIVKEHQIADVPVALFMSGGVDSTFLAAATENLDCFHLVSPESAYAEAVARRFDRRLVSVQPNVTDYTESLWHVTAFHGEPLMSSGIPYVVSREVREHGYTVAISANGADELFHGYPRTPMPEYTPTNLPLHEQYTFRWIGEQTAHIFRDRRNFSIEGLDEYILSIADLVGHAARRFSLSGFPPSASHRWFELMTYVLHDLNPTLDAASMANSIEVRVPFLDHRVVEGVLSWEASRLVTPKLGRKAPLKAFLTDKFPASFFHRPKLGFSIHADTLGPISSLGNEALERYERAGRLRFIEGAAFGERDRDRIYLGSCCLMHEIWEGCMLCLAAGANQ